MRMSLTVIDKVLFFVDIINELLQKQRFKPLLVYYYAVTEPIKIEKEKKKENQTPQNQSSFSHKNENPIGILRNF